MKKLFQKFLLLLRGHLDFSRRSLLVRGALLAACCAFLAGYVYLFGQLYSRPGAGEYFLPQPTGESPAVRQGMTLQQEFTFPCDRVWGLYLSFEPEQPGFSTLYLVTLQDETGETILVNDFTTTNGSPANLLIAPLLQMQGQRCTLSVTISRTSMENAARFALMEPNGFAPAARLDGEELPGALALQFNLAPTGGAATFVVVLVLAFILFALILLLSGRQPALNTLVFLCGLGAFVAVLNPLGDVPDEAAHVARAETLSQGRVFCASDTVYPSDQALRGIISMGGSGGNSFARFSDAHLYAVRMGSQGVQPQTAGTAGNYFFGGYLGGALALALGRQLQLPVMTTLYLGRVLNLFGYAALCTAAVALAPGFKRTLSLVACLPTSVFLAASFSPDGATIGLVLLTVSAFLRLRAAAPGSLTPKKTGLWVALALLAALTRISYLCLLLLLLTLPAPLYRRARDKRLALVQLAGGVALAMAWLALSGLRGLRPVGGASTAGQLAFLLRGPEGLRALLGSMLGEVQQLYAGLFSLGWGSYSIAYLGLALPFACLWSAGSEQPLAVTGRISPRPALALCGLIWFLTYLGMYLTANPVGSASVLGVQGRYFIELLALTPLVLGGYARGRGCRTFTHTALALAGGCCLLGAVIVQHYL